MYKKGPRLNPSQGLRDDIDQFPGSAKVAPEKREKYNRTKHVNSRGIRSKTDRIKYLREADRQKQAVIQAARSELLLNEEPGYLEADSDCESHKIKQHDIVKAVDITSATKFFDLSLPQFGPYHINFSRNGRNLLLGGSKGHIAAIDWVTKGLLCEINVMESVHDVTWLHMPTMFAAAQKRWVHIYDNVGTELHCIKQLYRIKKMEFLPYHFLLATSSDNGFLAWLDISMGKMVTQFYSKSGCLDVLCQNPTNAVLLTGHPNGTVNMWSPNVHEPLVKMMCHPKPIRAIAVDKTGVHLATASVDRVLKIWDLRNYKCLKSYKLGGTAGNISFSQTGLLGVTVGNVVEIYKDIASSDVSKPYLTHKLKSFAGDIMFCPYEDVLGVGHLHGYSSILVPGAGEPNFDATENNPFMSKSQRREMEVRSLLEKVQPEMITLNSRLLGQVDKRTLNERLDAVKAKKPKAQNKSKRNISTRSAAFLKKEAKLNENKELRRESLKNVTKVPKKAGGALGRFISK